MGRFCNLWRNDHFKANLDFFSINRNHKKTFCENCFRTFSALSWKLLFSFPTYAWVSLIASHIFLFVFLFVSAYLYSICISYSLSQVDNVIFWFYRHFSGNAIYQTYGEFLKNVFFRCWSSHTSPGKERRNLISSLLEVRRECLNFLFFLAVPL